MMMELRRNGVPYLAPNLSRVLALAADDFSGEFSGECIGICLAGDIQIDGDPLAAANGPSKESVLKVLSLRYLTKGEDFLRDLRGSFRLALWDAEKQKLLIAVDPFATRPLYYLCGDGVLVFAPRISCFSALPEISKEIDRNV